MVSEQALELAKADEQKYRNETMEARRRVAACVVEAFPKWLDELGRAVVTENHETSNKLGREQVHAMKSELEAAAAKVPDAMSDPEALKISKGFGRGSSDQRTYGVIDSALEDVMADLEGIFARYGYQGRMSMGLGLAHSRDSSLHTLPKLEVDRTARHMWLQAEDLFSQAQTKVADLEREKSTDEASSLWD